MPRTPTSPGTPIDPRAAGVRRPTPPVAQSVAQAVNTGANTGAITGATTGVDPLAGQDVRLAGLGLSRALLARLTGMSQAGLRDHIRRNNGLAGPLAAVAEAWRLLTPNQRERLIRAIDRQRARAGLDRLDRHGSRAQRSR